MPIRWDTRNKRWRYEFDRRVHGVRHRHSKLLPAGWTRDQADDLLAELPQHLAAMARFALATGLRETNIRLLTWDQVDLPRGVA